MDDGLVQHQQNVVAKSLTACSGEVVNKLFGRHHDISTSSRSARIPFNSVRFQFTFANASQLPATERDILLHPGCFFFFSGPERVYFFQPVLAQRAAFLLHPSLLSVLSAAERFTADKHKRGLQRIYFHIPPSVRLLVAAASRNAAVNFNPLPEEQ